jgi:TorA maturation chaperone TorD
MNAQPLENAILGNIIFIGETLGPFFLNDPKDGVIDASFLAIESLDVCSAAKDWPFVPAEQAQKYLETMQEGLKAQTGSEKIIWEYRRLFVGPAAKPAPAWGSVYTDKDGVVFGATTLELRAWMREAGIKRLSEEKVPEDHLGLMLLLMAWIAENKPEKLEDFLRLHFFTWSSHFLEQLINVAEHAFYQGLAQITKASLEGIQADLNLDVVYPKFYR